MEHPPTRGTSRCAPGAFSLTAPVFRSSRAQKGAWCARDSTWAAGPGAHGESTIFRQARSQPHHQHQKPRANQASNPGNTTPTPHQPHQHHQHQKPHTDHITGAGKPRANQASNPGNITHQPAATTSPTPKATRQSSQQPRQHHTPTRSNRSNRSTNARSHTPTASPAPENHTPTTSTAPCINASCTATGRRRTFP